MNLERKRLLSATNIPVNPSKISSENVSFRLVNPSTISPYRTRISVTGSRQVVSHLLLIGGNFPPVYSAFPQYSLHIV